MSTRSLTIRGGRLVTPGGVEEGDVLVVDGAIADLGEVEPEGMPEGCGSSRGWSTRMST